jgi:hypothetical protein
VELESKLHVFSRGMLVYIDEKVKKPVIQHPKYSDYFSETQTGLAGVSAVEVLMNKVS